MKKKDFILYFSSELLLDVDVVISIFLFIQRRIRISSEEFLIAIISSSLVFEIYELELELRV